MSPNQHGQHGRGRLAFHKLCQKASWYTKFQGKNACISIDSSKIKEFDVKTLTSKEQHALLADKEYGTCVELLYFTKNTIPDDKDFIELILNEFGYLLLLDKKKKILFNGQVLSLPKYEETNKEFYINNNVFYIRVIRWENKPTGEKSYNYLVALPSSKIVHKELSSLNNKANFYTSIFIVSEWATPFVQDNDNFMKGILFSVESDVWKAVKKSLDIHIRQIYENFLRKFAKQKVDDYWEQGLFPSYNDITNCNYPLK